MLIQIPDLNSHTELDQATIERLKSTGIITVLIHRVRNIRSRRRSTRPAEGQPQGMSKFGRVPDKAVQDLGLSHYGRYAASCFPPSQRLISYSVDTPERQKGIKRSTYKRVDGKRDERAIATFNFKYRSLGKLTLTAILPSLISSFTAILKALRVVPTTPEPIVLPTRPCTPTAEPALRLRQTNKVYESQPDQDGLSIPELLALNKAYRGSVDGLEGLSKTELMVLLEHHRVSTMLDVQCLRQCAQGTSQ